VPPTPITVWILGDQLLEKHPALTWAEAQVERSQIRVVLVESYQRRRLQGYHRRKIGFLLSAMHDYTKQLRADGFHAECRMADSFAQALGDHCREQGTGQVATMAASHYAGRHFQQERLADLLGLPVTVLPNSQFLVERFNPYPNPEPGKRYVMENFYRAMRRHFDLLMDGDEPVGGEWNYDKQNRKPLPKKHPAPPPLPSFPPNEDTQAILARILTEDDAPYVGSLTGFDLAVNRAQALTALNDFIAHRLPLFGPYEDAMSHRSRSLFHTRISSLVNIHRLLPSRVVADVAGMRLPLESKEGFIRQVLGWREFVRHVHKATDGFRNLPGGKTRIEKTPGDGGYERWAGKPWGSSKKARGLDGGAAPCALGCDTALPPAYWGEPSGLACLDRVVSDVWAEGYSHHITRLMILSNLATLLDVRPRELTDWFWVAYTDAYDWVVEPNVLGMGTYAVGGLMTTKPYVSGGAYINRMSDYCSLCSFDPKTNCPFTPLYWAFLARHEPVFKSNPRLRMPLATLAKRGIDKRTRDQDVFKKVREILEKGSMVTPQDLPSR
jgi:deoxyribodipyrimidine photolyase-related protein